MKTVLNRMYDAAYITKEEYDGALDYDLESDFIKKPKSNTERSYLVDEVEKRAKKILITKLAEEDGYTEEDLASDETLNKEYSVLADRDLRRNGYTIHTTIDKDIYNKAQEIVKNFQEYGSDTYEIDEETGEEIQKPVQTGGILIENHTGKIISFTGGRGYSEDSQLITPRLHHGLTGIQLNHCLIMHRRWKKVRFNREHLSLIFRGTFHSRVWQNHGVRTTMAVLFTLWFLPARPLHNLITCRLQEFTAKFTMIIRRKNT